MTRTIGITLVYCKPVASNDIPIAPSGPYSKTVIAYYT